MIHIQRIAKLSTNTKLAIQIRELEYPEKKYEEFRVRVRENNWKYISIVGKEEYNSEVVYFNNLLPEITYKISAQYKKDGIWIDIPSAVFYMQNYIQSIGNPASGGIAYRYKGD